MYGLVNCLLSVYYVPKFVCEIVCAFSWLIINTKSAFQDALMQLKG